MALPNRRPRFAGFIIAGRATKRLVDSLFQTQLGILLPVLLVLLLLAGVLALFNFVPAISPFVYPLM